jgi:hypothetical protein
MNKKIVEKRAAKTGYELIYDWIRINSEGGAVCPWHLRDTDNPRGACKLHFRTLDAVMEYFDIMEECGR